MPDQGVINGPRPELEKSIAMPGILGAHVSGATFSHAYVAIGGHSKKRYPSSR
jgi:hypothetical protein